MNMRPIVQQKSTEATEADIILTNGSIASTSIHARNWTTYIPNTEDTHKKCVDLSPDLVRLNEENDTIDRDIISNKLSPINCCCENTLEGNAAYNASTSNCSESTILKPNSETTSSTAQDFPSNDCDTASTLATQSDKLTGTIDCNDSVHLITTKTKSSPTHETYVAATAVANRCIKPSACNECSPLIQISPNKSITLVKQNSTSLIFTKKDVNPVVHRKRVTLVHSNSTPSPSNTAKKRSTADQTANSGNVSSESDIIPIISHTDEIISSPQKRHSYHWHSERGSGLIPSDKSSKRKKIKSWYAVIGSTLMNDITSNSDSEVSCIQSIRFSMFRSIQLSFFSHCLLFFCSAYTHRILLSTTNI